MTDYYDDRFERQPHDRWEKPKEPKTPPAERRFWNGDEPVRPTDLEAHVAKRALIGIRETLAAAKPWRRPDA